MRLLEDVLVWCAPTGVWRCLNEVVIERCRLLRGGVANEACRQGAQSVSARSRSVVAVHLRDPAERAQKSEKDEYCLP